MFSHMCSVQCWYEHIDRNSHKLCFDFHLNRVFGASRKWEREEMSLARCYFNQGLFISPPAFLSKKGFWRKTSFELSSWPDCKKIAFTLNHKFLTEANLTLLVAHGKNKLFNVLMEQYLKIFFRFFSTRFATCLSVIYKTRKPWKLRFFLVCFFSKKEAEAINERKRNLKLLTPSPAVFKWTVLFPSSPLTAWVPRGKGTSS